MLKDTNREKQMKMYLERLKEKEIEIKDAAEYKKNYLQLYKKIQKIFIDWNSQIKVNCQLASSNQFIHHCFTGLSPREKRQWSKS